MNEKPSQNGFCESWPWPEYKYFEDLKKEKKNWWHWPSRAVIQINTDMDKIKSMYSKFNYQCQRRQIFKRFSIWLCNIERADTPGLMSGPEHLLFSEPGINSFLTWSWLDSRRRQREKTRSQGKQQRKRWLCSQLSTCC